jgi:hypothetical protein
LAEKAERVFGRGLSHEVVRTLATLEPKSRSTLMAGSAKPLALARSQARTKKKASSDS